MEKDPLIKYANGQIVNYDIYATLEEDAILDLILHSLLDDSIFCAKVANSSMPQSCKNLFENVKELFNHIAMNISNENLISISDIGHMKITEIIDRKGKEVRIECFIHCEKVEQLVELNQYYLRIIRHLKQAKAESLIHSGLQNSSQSEIRENQQEKQNGSLLKGAISFINKKQYKFTRIFLTIDMLLTPNIGFFTKFHDEVKIQQFSHHRLKLYFNEAIPKGGCFYIKIKILKLKCNAFAIGIIDKNENRQVLRSPYSISFQYRSGEMKDAEKNKQKRETRWRRGGKATPDLNGATIKMEMNMLEQIISFYCNDELMGETYITNYLMAKNIVPYISCKHQGDTFLLNPED